MNEWLKGLMSRGKSLLWDAPAADVAPIVRDQETAVGADTFDELAYDMIHHAAPNLRKSIEQLAEDHDYVGPAYADLFQMLNQGDPMFKDRATMREGYDANHGLLSSLYETPEFQTLREHTVRDEWNTAFAMMTMQDDMARRFDQVKQAREEREQAQQDAQQAQDALSQAIDDAGQPDADGPTCGGVLQQATRNAQAAQDALDAAQAAQDAATASAAAQGAQSAAEASEEIDQQESAAGAYGLGHGELQRMSYDERKALTDKLDNAKLRDLAALVGSFRQYADAERRKKIKHAPSVIVDVELGDDISSLVNEEFNRLAIPELEDLFWINYAQRSLMQWLEAGPEKAGQGPILVVCDESWSMTSEVGPASAEAWSKALSLALSDQAKRGGRDFIYVGFSSHGDLWEKRFPKGQLDLDGVIEFSTHFYGNGTAYEAPLRRAQEIVREYGDSEKGKPDVVFITDDNCAVPKEFITEWAQTRKDLDITTYGIQIGPPASETMKKLCDKTIQLSALNATPEGMQELFATI